MNRVRTSAAKPKCARAGATLPCPLTPSCHVLTAGGPQSNRCPDPTQARFPPTLISYDHSSRLPRLTLGHINILSSLPPLLFSVSIHPVFVARARLPLSPTSPNTLTTDPPTPQHTKSNHVLLRRALRPVRLDQGTPVLQGPPRVRALRTTTSATTRREERKRGQRHLRGGPETREPCLYMYLYLCLPLCCLFDAACHALCVCRSAR